MKNKKIIIGLFVVSLFLFFMLIRKNQRTRFEKLINEYSQIDTWDKAQKYFENDQLKGNLKYFFFGLGYNKEFDSVKNKHDLDVYFIGDMIINSLKMYNYYIEKEIIQNDWNVIGTKGDSIWREFEIALETSNIDFLIENSYDSIYCAELQILGQTSNELYEKEFIFNNHLKELKHLNNLSTHKRNIYWDEEVLRVVFNIECKQAEENAYDLIFLFDKNQDKYLFKGMIMT
jgi:hypothetical protein